MIAVHGRSISVLVLPTGSETGLIQRSKLAIFGRHISTLGMMTMLMLNHGCPEIAISPFCVINWNLRR